MKLNLSMRVAAIALAVAAPALAAPVELASNVYVERQSINANGAEVVTLSPAERVVPGDRLRFVIRYNNTGGAAAGDFVITNPVPASVAYVGADGAPAPVVSIDGGVSYNELDALSVTQDDGSVRPARADEVTHVKWQFSERLAAGTSGEVAFRGELK